MLLAPVSSLAEFTHPSELFILMSKANLPVGFSGELHGNVDNFWFSAWLSGSSKGTNIANATGEVNGTFDVAKDGGKARVNFEMRVVDSNVYFYVDSIEGTYDDMVWHSALSMKTKTWVKIPVPADMAMDMTAADFSEMDSMLQLTTRALTNGTAYDITLTRDAAREMLQNLRDMDHPEWNEAFSAVPRTAAFHMTVSTNKADGFTAASATLDMGSKKVTVNAKGSAWLLTSLTVTAPKGAVSIEDWTSPLMNDFGGSMFDEPSAHDSTWDVESGSDWDTPTDDSSSSSSWSNEENGSGERTPANMIPEGDCSLDLDAVRHGECDTFQRTPRRLP